MNVTTFKTPLKKSIFNLENPTIRWLLLIFIAFTWGSSFILMKKGLLSFSSAEVATYRIFIAGVFMLPFALKHIKVLKNSKDFKILMLLGFLGNFIPAYLFTKAQTVLSSSFTGMLNSTVPLFTLFIGISFFAVTFKWQNLVGVFLGLLGVIGLIWQGDGISIDNHSWIYAILPIIATICYGINVNLLKTYTAHLKPIQITSLSFLILTPISGVTLLFTDFFHNLTHQEDALLSLSAITALGIAGTAVALLLFNALIQKTSALFASAVTYIIPIFAIMWGIIDGEVFPISFLIWIAIILFGVYLVNMKK